MESPKDHLFFAFAALAAAQRSTSAKIKALHLACADGEINAADTKVTQAKRLLAAQYAEALRLVDAEKATP